MSFAERERVFVDLAMDARSNEPSRRGRERKFATWRLWKRRRLCSHVLNRYRDEKYVHEKYVMEHGHLINYKDEDDEKTVKTLVKRFARSMPI